MYIVIDMNKLAYLLLVPLLAAGAWSPKPIRWSVVGASSARTVVAGRTANVTLQADIDKGWHIYSLTQGPGGPIPLRIQLLGGADLSLRGAIKAPKPVRALDKNSGIKIEIYSGSPRFTIPIGVPANSPKGVRKFQIAVRYQVCSDTLCFPPRTEKLDVTLEVKGPAR